MATTNNGTTGAGLGLEHARRIRAARVWAGLSRDELAERLGVSFQTIERSETGRRNVDLDELERVGEACGVPEAFMRYGWAACAQGERLDRLHERLDELMREVQKFGRAWAADAGVDVDRLRPPARASGR